MITSKFIVLHCIRGYYLQLFVQLMMSVIQLLTLVEMYATFFVESIC